MKELAQDNIFYKGDTIEMEFVLYRNKCTHEYWDLTNHQIRFQLNGPTAIKKATVNVTGGGDDQIKILDATHGKFLIIVTKIESDTLTPNDYDYEIELTTPEGERFTILQNPIRIMQDIVTWVNE
jgi:hypothetical protein